MKQRSRLKDMGSYVIKWACTIYCNMFIIYYIPSKSHFVDIARAHCSLLFRSRNNDILYSIPIYTYIYICKHYTLRTWFICLFHDYNLFLELRLEGFH